MQQPSQVVVVAILLSLLGGALPAVLELSFLHVGGPVLFQPAGAGPVRGELDQEGPIRSLGHQERGLLPQEGHGVEVAHGLDIEVEEEAGPKGLLDTGHRDWPANAVLQELHHLVGEHVRDAALVFGGQLAAARARRGGHGGQLGALAAGAGGLQTRAVEVGPAFVAAARLRLGLTVAGCSCRVQLWRRGGLPGLSRRLGFGFGFDGLWLLPAASLGFGDLWLQPARVHGQ
eukprot:8936139-Pyramimonas_sp.AAC.1